MTEVGDQPSQGEFFSRNYLRAETPSSDNPRARHRLSAYLAEHFVDKNYEVGKYIEQELGIKCLIPIASGYYISWEDFIKSLSIVDFLDVITATIRFLPRRTQSRERLTVQYDLLEFSRRVFLEQNLAYEIDPKGGIHPKIDASFSIASASLIRNLSAAGLVAAREHVVRAERSLLASKLETRAAIRATFDAAENLLKVISPSVTQLNKQSINEKLRPYLVDASSNSRLEHQASEKLLNALIDWTEAAHFFRHASGGAEQDQPTESFTVAFVSQGFSYIRWIADIYVSKQNDPGVTGANR